jgi:hypothetical protein
VKARGTAGDPAQKDHRPPAYNLRIPPTANIDFEENAKRPRERSDAWLLDCAGTVRLHQRKTCLSKMPSADVASPICSGGSILSVGQPVRYWPKIFAAWSIWSSTPLLSNPGSTSIAIFGRTPILSIGFPESVDFGILDLT